MRTSVTHLIAKGMSSYDNGFDPAWDRLRNLGKDDGLAEHRSSQYIPNLSVYKHRRNPASQSYGTLNWIHEERTVPLGLLHICFKLNSLTRASSGVIVAHLIPTLYLIMALAASTVTWSLV